MVRFFKESFSTSARIFKNQTRLTTDTSLEEDQLTNGDNGSKGDLKYHTDFRQIYATILDKWLECDSRHVLGERFEHVDFLNS